ncbi:MAG: hypothetical protein KAQ63_03200 [Candidatus Moranbacteria bacterium]|nr:hypothetical protein [Candidatus Moranbacteria bacterium]
MSLFKHLSIHFTLSVVAGLVVGIWQGDFLLSILFAILGGFLIDVDHLLDYFLSFGFNFNFKWFREGRQFLKSDKIFVWFHAWEYVIILFGISFVLDGTQKIAILAFCLSLLIHLIADCLINYGVKLVSYFIFYRIWRNFEIEKLATKKHWIKHQEKKRELIKNNNLNEK